MGLGSEAYKEYSVSQYPDDYLAEVQHQIAKHIALLAENDDKYVSQGLTHRAKNYCCMASIYIADCDKLVAELKVMARKIKKRTLWW